MTELRQSISIIDPDADEDERLDDDDYELGLDFARLSQAGHESVAVSGQGHWKDATPQQDVFLTAEGFDRLRVPLEHPKQHQSPRLTAWLSVAVSEGYKDEDVTEIETTRAELLSLTECIHILEDLLSSAELLVGPENNHTMGLGSYVTILASDDD